MRVYVVFFFLLLFCQLGFTADVKIPVNQIPEATNMSGGDIFLVVTNPSIGNGSTRTITLSNLMFNSSQIIGYQSLDTNVVTNIVWTVPSNFSNIVNTPILLSITNGINITMLALQTNIDSSNKTNILYSISSTPSFNNLSNTPTLLSLAAGSNIIISATSTNIDINNKTNITFTVSSTASNSPTLWANNGTNAIYPINTSSLLEPGASFPPTNGLDLSQFIQLILDHGTNKYAVGTNSGGGSGSGNASTNNAVVQNWSGIQNFTNINNQFTGTFTGNGAGLTNVQTFNASTNFYNLPNGELWTPNLSGPLYGLTNQAGFQYRTPVENHQINFALWRMGDYQFEGLGQNIIVDMWGVNNSVSIGVQATSNTNDHPKTSQGLDVYGGIVIGPNNCNTNAAPAYGLLSQGAIVTGNRTTPYANAQLTVATTGAGTFAAPSAFFGDLATPANPLALDFRTTTVAWLNSWNDFGFACNNGAVTNLYLTVGGNVGIGTNAPAAKLHVVGSAIVRSNLTVGGTISGDGSSLTNLQSLAISGNLVTTFPTNTVVGYMQIALKFGTTNLFIPVCYTNQ